MTDIVERLRSNQPLVICPYDSKSPEYWTTPNDTSCKFCGGFPDAPDKCTGADTRIMGEAADEISRLRQFLSEAETRKREARREALEEAAAYHDDLAAQHAASHEHVESDHHEMMERQHVRFAAAIRALQSEER